MDEKKEGLEIQAQTTKTKLSAVAKSRGGIAVLALALLILGLLALNYFRVAYPESQSSTFGMGLIGMAIAWLVLDLGRWLRDLK